MSATFPLSVQKVVNLADPPFNLPEKAFRYNTLTLESPRFICVKDTSESGAHQVAIIDLHRQNEISRRPTKKAEAGLMHRTQNIIVLRGTPEKTVFYQRHGLPIGLQIFNLDTKSRMSQVQFTQEIVFLKWATDDILAVVTTDSVWHCDITVPDAAEEIFKRSEKLAESDVQIINYAVDANVKWCFLAGISSQDRKTIDGYLQLYSMERKQHQLLQGHTACFGKLITEEFQPPIQVFSFVERKNNEFKIHIMDIYSPKGQTPSLKISAPLQFNSESPSDFPIFEHLTPKYGQILLVSRGGYVIVVDALTGTTLFSYKVSPDLVFVSCGDDLKGGILFANRKGMVFSATINEDSFIPYIQRNVSQPQIDSIVVSLVKRCGFPGAEDIMIQSFNAAFAAGNYKTAARIAATLKGNGLRTAHTISQFKTAPQQPNQVSPILQYFSTLLEVGQLNELETMELVRPIVAQGKWEFIHRWLDDQKLACTEELGDLLRPHNEALALRVYEKAKAVNKVLQIHLERGSYDKIIAYVKDNSVVLDYTLYLSNMLNVNSEAAVNFAIQLLSNTPPLIEIDQVIKVFKKQNCNQELTSVLLTYLAEDTVKNEALQTFLFELNLTHNPQVAEAIFQMNKYTHYNRHHIGKLCEKAGLFQRALDHYTDPADIKRVLARQHNLSADWLITYFAGLSSENELACLDEMLKASNRHNLQALVQIAIQHHERLGSKRLIELFESHAAWEGLFYFLGSIISTTQDPDIHLKYIMTAAKLNKVADIERICRESQAYDPVKVKDFLKDANLSDPRPLIYVCDRHHFVAELAQYLYERKLLKYIEVYVLKVNCAEAPTVIGTLLDLDCPDDVVKHLLAELRDACPHQRLIEEVEKRNRLAILQPWLEARAAESTQDSAVYNALAKIYVDTNHDPETFLKTNQHYDGVVVGQYCEDRDPYLAFTAYQKDWGSCDDQILRLTDKNALFRLQAKYLIERRSPDLWEKVLSPSNPLRNQVIDHILLYALSETVEAEDMVVTIRALEKAAANRALMELLDKLVFHHPEFLNSEEFQNLLLITAIQEEPQRVSQYVSRLDNYDARKISQFAISEPYCLYEEALLVYRKHGMMAEAMHVLIDKLGAVDRAADLALACNQPAVWATLGKAYLQHRQVHQAIAVFLKAQDSEAYLEVIELAEEQAAWPDLIEFLTMAKKKVPVKDAAIDTALLRAYAKSERYKEMQEFAKTTIPVTLQSAGDKLSAENYYKAAELIYAAIPDYAKVVSCHLKLGNFEAALEAAKKASKPRTWKDLSLACIQANQFQTAFVAATQIVSHPDHLDELIAAYEARGNFNELIAVLEAGLQADSVPQSLFTELGITYAKYQPDKLFGFLRHLTPTSARFNLAKLIQACHQNMLWKEAIHLHKMYQEFNPAAAIMLANVDVWDHAEFLSIIQKVSDIELYYRSVEFYLDVDPLHLNEVLIAVAPRIDHTRVVHLLRQKNLLCLIQEYLEFVQTSNVDNFAVNTALNELYFEAEDAAKLAKSVHDHPNFNQLDLAHALRAKEDDNLRRLACHIYRSNQMYHEALALAKAHKYFCEAIESARQSRNTDMAESLLHYFVAEVPNSVCFVACLYKCYDLIRPDVAVELAWKAHWTDEIMPYKIQVAREFAARLETLEKQMDQHRDHASKPDYAFAGETAETKNLGRVGQEGAADLSTLAMLAPSVGGTEPPPLFTTDKFAWASSSPTTTTADCYNVSGAMRF